MNTTRATLLREMGLTPIWQQRTPFTPEHLTPIVEAAAEAPAETTKAVSPSDETAIAYSDAPSTVNPQPTISREETIAQLDWDALHAHIASCTACKLSKTRRQTVPGVGNRQPALMVIGEGPGENEDKQGEPFVGRAGQLLDAMLAAIQQKRGEQVYIANVVKCRPPGNRNPEADEISACFPYLQRQIDLAQPQLLLAAGKIAAQTLLNNHDDSVGTLRRRGGNYEDKPVIVTYHPSYLLREPKEKSKAWEDLQKVRNRLADGKK